MPLADILKLGPLDPESGQPIRRFTNQELADMALAEDRAARAATDLLIRAAHETERDALCAALS